MKKVLLVVADIVAIVTDRRNMFRSKSYFLPALQIYYLPFDNVFQKPSIYFPKLVINITVSHIFAILMKLFISTKNREVNDL